MKITAHPAALSRATWSARCRSCKHSWEISADQHPRPTKCERCQLADLVVISGREYGRPRNVATHLFTCDTCRRSREEEVNLDAPDAMSARDCLDPECPGRAHPNYSQQNINRYGEVWTGGGYFNHGLGEFVTSQRDLHNKADAKGLVPVEGDLDVEGWCRNLRAKREREDAEYDLYQQRLEDDPAFHAYRKVRDQGQMKDPEANDDTIIL